MSRQIPILYEDQDITVFDKPSGVLVVPEPRGTGQTLEDLVNTQCPLTSQGRLYPCHRLDRETTGAIIFARGKSNQQKVMDEFRKGAVKKTYIAFVRGKMKRPAGEIKSLIRDFHHSERGRRPEKPKPALTRYKVLSVKRLFSVVEVFPLTGRTNQIRIHMAEIGHPILGERLYAFGKDFELKFPRVALHAGTVEFVHPRSGLKISVVSSLAKDMENFLNRY